MELKDFIILIRGAVQRPIDYCGEASTDEVVDLVSNLYKQSYGGQDWGTSDDIETKTIHEPQRNKLLIHKQQST
ncbi:hypothetical protein RND71_004885 [Anisodus tanguticus]|uniref:Uncharacterized protein n=1 Tax=Anisodus tanguticus TaxID=243964 RepID=A0AAE1SRD3_9SOLA|nr:hypothetical protein RND71_004885 [Anisodus tanguticus]